MKMELNVHSKSMIAWGKAHPEAVVLSGDLGSSCEVKEFRSELPEQYFSMGLTEQNMVGWAAGRRLPSLFALIWSFPISPCARSARNVGSI